MGERKTSNALEWLKNAKDKFRAFAYGDQPRKSERPRVGLALAGGFARGIAHIGVLQVLQEARVPIDCVAGTSVGALIGVGYCAGATAAEMQELGAITSFADFGRWTPSWLGLATNQRLEKYLARLTPLKTFEELRVPMAISTTDITAGITVYYSSGPIAPALRASCAYPGLFVPIQYDGRTLVDGFLTSPVPVEGALLLGADVVIAVFLETGGVDNPRTAVDIISRSFSILQRHADITWRQQTDVIIEPDVHPFGWDDFTRTPEMVAAGREAALKALPEIRAALRGEKRETEQEDTTQPSNTST
ncbi:MAG TPA: patatin-like phospholipase family protein [Terriglobales bacterium]|nr:patatin-like phospholipase family protein [Terriglobales bacterium]